MTSERAPDAVAGDDGAAGGVPRSFEEALSAARSLAPRFASRAGEYDRDGRFPQEDLADLRREGLLGLFVPQRLGGPGATFAQYSEVARALALGNGATALVFNMHASVTGALAQTPDGLARALGASDAALARRDAILRGALAGAFYAVAMSERGAGARLSAIATTYERVDGGFHLLGDKAFVSGAGHADGYLVAARAAGSDEDHPTISYFLVPAGPGVTVEETWDSLGMRATESNDVHLDVTVDDDALLGGVEGLALLLADVMPQWLVASYAAVYVGVAEAVIAAARDHITERGTGRLAPVRARLGRADAAVAAAGLTVAEAARRVDEAPGTPETNRWVWRAKLIAGDTAAEVAASCLEAAGSAAMRRGCALERLFRDARCGALQPASSDVCADWLGLAALGRDPLHDASERRW